MKYSTDDLKIFLTSFDDLDGNRFVVQAAIEVIERLQSQSDESAKLWRDVFVSEHRYDSRARAAKAAGDAVDHYEKWLKNRTDPEENSA